MKTASCLVFSVLFSIHILASEIYLSDLGPEVTRLEPISIQGTATFESLNADPILPKKNISFTDGNSSFDPNLIKALARSLAYPAKNYGSPTGGFGINLGGAGSEDTQVFTLGVPITLPQGGGTDLSFFPSYLWSSAEVMSAPSQAGFSQQASSGSLELKPWTREMLLHSPQKKSNENQSQVTLTYNREVQSFSIGTRYAQTAVIAGSNFGKETGPAGSISHIISGDRHHQILFHVLGSDLEGENGSSIYYPSPQAIKKMWRIIPVLESHQDLTENLTLETTLFSDILRYQTIDPVQGNYDSHTYQYGIENALLLDSYTLGLSARFVRFDSTYFTNHSEIPLHASLGKETELNSHFILHNAISYDYVALVGSGVGAKTGLKYSLDLENSIFGEIQTLPKLPSLINRYYQQGTLFVGFPNLKPEQDTFATLGHEYKSKSGFTSTTLLKGEYREKIQARSGNTITNAGIAHLYSLSQENDFLIAPLFKIKNSALLTRSHLDQKNISYPDLPDYSDRMQFFITPEKTLTFNFAAQWVGDSQGYNERFYDYDRHGGYSLYDFNVVKKFKTDWFDELALTVGLENLFDRRAEVLMGYPLPGRMVLVGMMGKF